MPTTFAETEARRRKAFAVDALPALVESLALPPIPLPASSERVEMLHERAIHREALHQAGDVIYDPAQVVYRTRSRNGQDVRMKSRKQVQATPEVGERVKRVSTRVDGIAGEVKDRRALVFAAAPPTLLASRLRELRTGRGLSLGQVAIGTGVSPQCLHTLEHGQRRYPHLCVLLLLADFFHVTLDNLVGRETH